MSAESGPLQNNELKPIRFDCRKTNVRKPLMSAKSEYRAECAQNILRCLPVMLCLAAIVVPIDDTAARAAFANGKTEGAIPQPAFAAAASGVKVPAPADGSNIVIAASSERDAFQAAQRANTVRDWDRFLAQFPSGRLAGLARDARNALLAASPPPASVPTERDAFQAAQRANTARDWDRFLAQFPTGRLAGLARDARNALLVATPPPAAVPNERDAFREAQRINTVREWDRFLAHFPSGRLAGLARDARNALLVATPPPAAVPNERDAFRTAQRVNTIAEWDHFLSLFPNGRLANVARDARDDLIAAAPPAAPSRRDAFRIAQRTNTIAGWNRFLADFPNGRLADLARDARDDLIAAAPPAIPNERQAFETAQRINTIAEWDRFLALFPNGRLANLARDAQDDLIAAAAPPLSVDPSSYWNQDGSLLALVAQGNRRSFVYSNPARHLVGEGVAIGMELFSGVNDRSFYTGTAYSYSPTCGKQGYPVAGPVENSGRRVVLRGREPQFRRDCSIRGYRAQTMVFDFAAKAN